MKYLDSSLSAKERAKDLLSRMSIKEKMSQVRCCMPRGMEAGKSIDQCNDGIGAVSSLLMRLCPTLEGAVGFQRGLQEMIMEQSEHNIPAIFHTEGLCGIFVQDATSYPGGISRGASFNPELEEKIGESVARQALAVGMNHVFAPVLDVTRDPRMGRQGESYSEDPTLAAAMGTKYTKGIQGVDINGRKAHGVAKHFVGSHVGIGGIHGADSQIPERLLREVFAKPFQAAMTEAQLKGIMPCYNTINGQAVSCSKDILSKLLKEEMGFDDLVVSDYGAINNAHVYGRLYESPAETGLHSMKAGMHMELPQKECFDDELEQWFANGTVDIKILDENVLKVLETKFEMGLFEQPFGLEGEELKAVFYDESDHDISLQSALESMVLLKNDGILPLQKDIKKIALIGSHGASAKLLFGGYTHYNMSESMLAHMNSMAGVDKDIKDGQMKTYPGSIVERSDAPKYEQLLKKLKPDIKSLLEELQEAMPNTEVVYSMGYPITGNDNSGYEDALEVAKDADLIILTLGGKNGSGSTSTMGEGVDATDINLPECQEEFIKRAAELGKPMVGVHINGRPISSDAADLYLNAIVEAWIPSEKGAMAIKDVLIGAYNPGGRLPVTVAYNAGQIPIYYNHPNGSSNHQAMSIGFDNYVDMSHHPRYAFGFGLSYTEFSYSNLVIQKDEENKKLVVSVNIKNTGTVHGDEVVQIYMEDLLASSVRPCMELVGFKRIHILADEIKTLTFEMKYSQFAFLDEEMKWKVEEGEMKIMAGSASNDIRLADHFRIDKSYYVDGRDRGFYAHVEVN